MGNRGFGDLGCSPNSVLTVQNLGYKVSTIIVVIVEGGPAPEAFISALRATASGCTCMNLEVEKAAVVVGGFVALAAAAAAEVGALLGQGDGIGFGVANLQQKKRRQLQRRKSEALISIASERAPSGRAVSATLELRRRRGAFQRRRRRRWACRKLPPGRSSHRSSRRATS